MIRPEPEELAGSECKPGEVPRCYFAEEREADMFGWCQRRYLCWLM